MPHQPHEQIAQRSFLIWEQEGRPTGHALDHWLQAERELAELFTKREQPQAISPAPKARPKTKGATKAKTGTRTRQKPTRKA
ncbi:DUF2934 domain-containing protein [Kordiimonas sp.]|uniref:DUF2934 domain-containing protein n=1 Tax=Kordiimonas sp. TaxID=1970157 RepID=UPI003A922E00